MNAMTDREKLFNLLDSAIAESKKFCNEQGGCKSCRYREFGVKCQAMTQVDYLIANGVEIYNEEDEKELKNAQQRVMEAHGDLRYLQGVKFGVDSATKHGRWNDRPAVKGQVYCSECGTVEKSTDSNYKSRRCPNCGAKMDGESNGG